MKQPIFNLEALQTELSAQSPRTIVKAAFDQFDSIAVSFSGAEDVALIDMAVKLKPGVRVFCLDTGRLHPQTYRFIDKVREHYSIQIDVLVPSPDDLEPFIRAKGLYSFYRDGHSECCGIRKVQPLRRYLAQLDAWITGQRRDQNPTRGGLQVVELDTAFATATKPLYKFNPLADWTSTQVWGYIEAFDVPYNELHGQGYTSIGCEPCTRPILPNQHERAGRWWWEESGKKECGLHVGKSPA